MNATSTNFILTNFVRGPHRNLDVIDRRSLRWISWPDVPHEECSNARAIQRSRDMRLMTIGGSVLMVLVGAAFAPVSAQQAFTFDASTVAQSLVIQSSTTDALFAQTRRGAAPRATLGVGPRTLGVGLRTGGFGFGVGASLRSWFEASPWGFQVGVSHYGY